VLIAACPTVSNVVGMFGTKAGLSLQIAIMRVYWCVSPFNVLPTCCQPFPRHCLLSVCIDQLDKADTPLIQSAYKYLLGVQVFVSISDGLAEYTFPLYNTLALQKPPAVSTEPVRAPGPALLRFPYTEPAGL
jgi:hypothetical protein